MMENPEMFPNDCYLMQWELYTSGNTLGSCMTIHTYLVYIKNIKIRWLRLSELTPEKR